MVHIAPSTKSPSSPSVARGGGCAAYRGFHPGSNRRAKHFRPIPSAATRAGGYHLAVPDTYLHIDDRETTPSWDTKRLPASARSSYHRRPGMLRGRRHGYDRARGFTG